MKKKHIPCKSKRQLTLTLSFLLLVVSCFPQEYKPLVAKENKLWSQVIYELPSFSIMTEFIKIKGDTTIDNYLYMKVFRATDENHNSWENYGFIRETNDKKVYYRADTSKQEYLFYDFSVELNDTVSLTGITSFNKKRNFTTMTFQITNIDSILIGLQYQKRVHLKSIYGSLETDQWIEGIGSLSGLLYWDGGLVGGDNYDLICFFEDDVLQYHDNDYSSCYIYTSVNNLQNENKLIEFTTDKNETLLIHNNHSKIGQLRLFNASGKLLLIQNIQGFETKICLPTGRFLIYQYQSKDGKIQTGKIVVR